MHISWSLMPESDRCYGIRRTDYS